MKSKCLNNLLNNAISIQNLLKQGQEKIGATFIVSGWVRTVRSQKKISFLEVNDGSSLNHLQIVSTNPFAEDVTTGACVLIEGVLTENPKNPEAQKELKLTHLHVLGVCPPSFPLQKKTHSFEFLRTIAHLRPRTNVQGAVARVRSRLAYLTHEFFQDLGYLYLQSPIITGSDCEGGGALFQVTTLNPKEKQENYTKDFFGKAAYLTVSGQLNGEAYASAFSKIYTFGPTFRAENSHTTRHLAEFWMIEPEVAFANLTTVINLAQNYLKSVIKKLLSTHYDDLNFFEQKIEAGLLKRLTQIIEAPFTIMTYTEVIDLLQKEGKKFEITPNWGIDLQTEHERFLTDSYFNGPVIVTDYPKSIKAFYMRENEDQKTVAAMDLLVPKIGELIGGSQREERYLVLKKKMEEASLNIQEYEWYLDLRKYGSAPHGGFGVGFERLVQFATGIENIRDVNPFPRTPGNCSF